MTTLTPAHPPTYGLEKEKDFRTLVNSFGDGYEQGIPDGLNNVTETWNPVWVMNEEDTDDLADQLDALNGAPFDWLTPSGYTKKFTCRSYKKVFVEYDNYRLSATFKESFVQ